MSNCITLHAHTLELDQEDFDIEAYSKLLEEHKDHPEPKGDDLFCWFLRDNSRLEEDGTLRIAMGNGQSGHTWRDLRQTIWFLNPFFRRPFSHNFIAADESDGYDQVFNLQVKWPYKSWEELSEKV